jgi:hypothetical protein
VESRERRTCPKNVNGMARRLAPMYKNPIEASSGMGYEHSTVDTMVAGTTKIAGKR